MSVIPEQQVRAAIKALGIEALVGTHGDRLITRVDIDAQADAVTVTIASNYDIRSKAWDYHTEVYPIG